MVESQIEIIKLDGRGQKIYRDSENHITKIEFYRDPEDPSTYLAAYSYLYDSKGRLIAEDGRERHFGGGLDAIHEVTYHPTKNGITVAVATTYMINEQGQWGINPGFRGVSAKVWLPESQNTPLRFTHIKSSGTYEGSPVIFGAWEVDYRSQGTSGELYWSFGDSRRFWDSEGKGGPYYHFLDLPRGHHLEVPRLVVPTTPQVVK